MRHLIILDHSLASKGGHYFEYSRSVAQAAARAGWGVRILANRRLQLNDEDTLASALGCDEVRGVFDYGWDLWSELPPDQPGPGHFGHDVLRELAAVAAGADDLVLAHTVGWSQLAQLLWSLAATPGWRAASLPRFSIVLRYDPRDLDVDYTAGLALLFDRLAANAPMAARVRFHTDTDRLTSLCARLLRAPISTLPIPFDQVAMQRALDDAAAQNGAEGRALNLVYIGDAREEKGYTLLPDMVRQLWDSQFNKGRLRLLAQSNFNIAGGEAAVPEARRRLRQFPSPEIHLLTSALDTDAYYALLAAADIVLIPYDPVRYQARSSGTLVQAQCAGKVVVTSVGSWMETRPRGGMVTFHGQADFTDAVRRAVEEHESLRAQALAAAPAWRAEASPDHFIEVLEQSHDWATAPAMALTGPSVLFVMDADAMILRNGASAVARSQLRGLFDLGCRVTGLLVQMSRPLGPEALFSFARSLEEAMADLPFQQMHLCSYAPAAGAEAAHDLFCRAERAGEYSIERDLNFQECLQIPAALWRAVAQDRPRLVVLNYVTNLPLLDKLGLLTGPDPVPVLCEIHDIQSFQKAIYGQRDVSDTDLNRELALLARTTVAVSLSALEADLLRRHLPALPVRHLPSPVPDRPIGPADLAGIPGLDALVRLAGACPGDMARLDRLSQRMAGWRQLDLLYVSSAHKPNIDGLRWFLDKVFLPLLAPLNMTLAIVGDVADQGFWPDHPNIALVGRVAQLRSFYTATRIVVLPIFGGAGSPIKVLEALSLGRAVVGTSYALRQLADDSGMALAIADTPASFADAVRRLAESPERRATAAAAGLAVARAQQPAGGRHARFRAVAADILGIADGGDAPPAPVTEPYHEWDDGWQAVNRSVSLVCAGTPASLADLRNGADALEKMDMDGRVSLLDARPGASRVKADQLAQSLPTLLRVAAGQAQWTLSDNQPAPVTGGRLELAAGSCVRSWVLMPADAPFQVRISYGGQGEGPPSPILRLHGVQSAERTGDDAGSMTYHCHSQPSLTACVLVGIELEAGARSVVVADIQLSTRHVPWLRAADGGNALAFEAKQGWQGIAMGVNDIPYARSLEAGAAALGITQLCGWRPEFEVTLLDLGGRDWQSLALNLRGGARLPASGAQAVVGGIRVVFHDPAATGQVETGLIHLVAGEAERGLAVASLTQTISILSPTPSQAPMIAGHVDMVSDDGIVRGWVWDATAPRQRLTVQVVGAGGVIASTSACAPRPDVRQAGFGDGLYGFSLTLPPSARDCRFAVQIAETSTILAGDLAWR